MHPLAPLRFSAALVLLFACGQGIALTETALPVSASPGTAIDDSLITARIKAAYVHDPVVKALDIQVTTVQGVVQLSGAAHSETEKDLAAAIARGIAGVREVRNDIRVK